MDDIEQLIVDHLDIEMIAQSYGIIALIDKVGVSDILSHINFDELLSAYTIYNMVQKIGLTEIVSNLPEDKLYGKMSSKNESQLRKLIRKK